ncbi:hypothetical protein P2559Y_0047 [Croceibacter phage P2559Y]|uniref:hypothetical protein n=1 Tax=Croceibacter phage P2559Y TaxID=1327037 RepID=UPI0003F4AB04|nr:hypothetical protein P2559Y_0047 [Croceibacter phage P2559Y]AGM14110.1 hypothetical protein P2559Y_0047 [Croceibacter phage P2559Y]
MRYDIKLLKDGLRDVKRERDDIMGRSFPFLHQEEIDKVDAIVDQVESTIKLLEDTTFKVDAFANKRALKLEDYPIISARFARGENLQTLADEYGVSYKTIQRSIKHYKENR